MEVRGGGICGQILAGKWDTLQFDFQRNFYILSKTITSESQIRA